MMTIFLSTLLGLLIERSLVLVSWNRTMTGDKCFINIEVRFGSKQIFGVGIVTDVLPESVPF